MKVRLKHIENPDKFYAFYIKSDDLKKDKIYEIIEIEMGYYRIENEFQEPVLY